MLYRTHGGLDISEIGIGCYALSGAYGQKDPEAFKAMLRRAYELGVNFFDTADAYGDAEAILGEVVKPFSRGGPHRHQSGGEGEHQAQSLSGIPPILL